MRFASLFQISVFLGCISLLAISAEARPLRQPKQRVLNPVQNVPVPRNRTDDEELCDNGDGNACERAAVYLDEEGNKRGAFALFERGCTLRNGSACYSQGVSYRFTNSIRPANFELSNVYFEKSCDLGYREGCLSAGVVHENGMDTPINAPRAAVFYEKGCDLREVMSCRNLGKMYTMGLGIQRDTLKANRYLEIACNGNDAYGCALFGHNLIVANKSAESASYGRERMRKALLLAAETEEAIGTDGKALVESFAARHGIR